LRKQGLEREKKAQRDEKQNWKKRKEEQMKYEMYIHSGRERTRKNE